MARGRWLPLALGTLAAALVLLPLAAGATARDGAGPVALPDKLAGYSYLNADVSNAPSGRTIALYQHGFGVEFMDFPQAVVLAADDDVYRRLGAAEDRGGAESQGDPGPMLLSPDGESVALGDHDTGDADLGVVDLTTGAVTWHALPVARSVIPIAWSPDSTEVAYLSRDEPTNPHSGTRLSGDLYVLDLESGVATSVPGDERALTAAFSPDGQQLAVQRTGGGTEALTIVDLSEETVRAFPADGQLNGPTAWSPDGRLLAMNVQSGISFVDTTGVDGSAPIRLALDDATDPQILGWTAEREVALLESPHADSARLAAHALDGRGLRDLMRMDDLGSYGVGRFQLATALTADAGVRAAGDPDRGPLPTPFRILLAAAVGLGVAGLTALVLHRRRTAPSPIRPRVLDPGPTMRV